MLHNGIGLNSWPLLELQNPICKFCIVPPFLASKAPSDKTQGSLVELLTIEVHSKNIIHIKVKFKNNDLCVLFLVFTVGLQGCHCSTPNKITNSCFYTSGFVRIKQA